jgi:hypothetical protein
MAYGIGLNGFCMNLARAAGRFGRNQLSVIYVMTLEWYCKGVMDYCESGKLNNPELFKAKQFARLHSDGTISRAARSVMVSDTQFMCFKRAKIDRDEAYRNRFVLKELYYRWFTRAIALASIEKEDGIT